jgi:hypothetical protein
VFRTGSKFVAVLTASGALAALPSAAGGFTFHRFKIALYKVTVGLSGQAHENASGLPCKAGYEICDENASAEYHVDMTYQNVELVISGKAPGGMPTYTGNTKHIVNGSFEETGHYLPGGAGSDSPPQSFSCNGALSESAPEGGGDNLSWKRHWSGLNFQAITERYGFDGTAHGSDPCNGSAWFGGGRLEYKNEMTAFFTVSGSELKQKSFAKTVGGPDARYREPDTCYEDADTGSCKFDMGWTAIVKFKRTRVVSS